MEHSNRVSVNGQISLLFVEPGSAALPEHCCTLSISPLVRELIVHLETLPQDYVEDSPTGLLTSVLLHQLSEMPIEKLHLPFPANVRLRKIANALINDPSNRNTIVQWAAEVAMSERSLARLVVGETGMTIGRWRRQLRVIAALQKLASGNSVQRVSEDLGYDSVSAFITMFKSTVGRTPGYYHSRRERPN
jgi:AraC-like DNA-binding protein